MTHSTRLIDWSEVLLSVILVGYPQKRWLNWILVSLFLGIIFLSIMGLFARSVGLA